jgi:Ca2+-binding EF-hand superfamily protein
MARTLPTLLGIGVLSLVTTAAPAADKPRPKLPPQLLKLLQASPEEFLKRFDKNGDGVLTRDELPPRLAQAFDQADRNGDGKLDKQEVAALLQMLRQRFGVNRPGAPADPVERRVNQILAQMDANMDGKISKEEAQGAIAANFDRIDTNKDGFIDRDELRRMVARNLAAQAKKGGEVPAAAPDTSDFDALDRNADGWLTRDELKGTPWADRFDEIDTNKDGHIDRKEFAAYLKKQAEKK